MGLPLPGQAGLVKFISRMGIGQLSAKGCRPSCGMGDPLGRPWTRRVTPFTQVLPHPSESLHILRDAPRNTDEFPVAVPGERLPTRRGRRQSSGRGGSDKALGSLGNPGPR